MIIIFASKYNTLISSDRHIAKMIHMTKEEYIEMIQKFGAYYDNFMYNFKSYT